MSYKSQAKLEADSALRLRVSACAATLGISNPAAWAMEHAWPLSAEPGWDDAYASALAADDPDPGGNETVITDGMILAAVEAIVAAKEPVSPAE